MNRRSTCFVPTDVMEPTLKKGSTIVVDAAHYFVNEPIRWDLAVFFAPELESLYQDLGQKRIEATKCGLIANAAVDIFEREGFLARPHIAYVKRIVGLPGERIAFTKSAILCDGEPLEPPRDLQKVYRSFPEFESYKFGATEHEVPKDSVFVLSDNLKKGKDSREVGPVKVGNLSARVVR